MVTEKIAQEFKKSIEGFDTKRIEKQIARHYQLLHLLDQNGKWASPRLDAIKDQLLPKNMTIEKLHHFIDEMASVAEKNPYLVQFLQKSQDQTFEKFAFKVNSEGKNVLPDVLAYSIALQNLTSAMLNDYRVMEDCHDVFVKARKETGAFKELTTFMKIKLLSVEKPIRDYIEIHKKGIDRPQGVSPSRGKYLLGLNIMEATLSDVFSRNFQNARTGLSLAMHHAGTKRFNPNTQAGPSGYSEDKKAITYSMPLPKKWTDLYETWNMAFVSKIPDFPYWMPKLCIPMVADYEKKPKEFIYRRALALYLSVNHAGFDYLERRKNNIPLLNWTDQALTKAWGRVNIKSTFDYEKEVALKKSLPIHRAEEIQKQERRFGFIRILKKKSVEKEIEHDKEIRIMSNHPNRVFAKIDRKKEAETLQNRMLTRTKAFKKEISPIDINRSV